MQNKGYVLLEPFRGTSSRDLNGHTMIKRVECGHEWKALLHQIAYLDVKCKICNNKHKRERFQFLNAERRCKYIETASEWNIFKTKVQILSKQTYRKHKHIINPNNVIRDRAGVDGAYHLDHIVPIRYCFEHNIPAEICADMSNLQMLQWRENISANKRLKPSIPPIFYNYIQPSERQKSQVELLKTLVPGSQTFVKIGTTTATLYNKQKNLAIIILSLSVPTTQLQLLGMIKNLQENKVKYFIIFEDELQKVALLTSKLSHYTHQNQMPSIYARKCSIKVVLNSAEKSKFLNTNHMQGNDKAHIAYGAYYEDQLVAIMTFAHPRVALGQKNKDRSTYVGKWELSRFATDINYRVPGIASKLLNHFKKNHMWSEIYSYADRRWSQGNLYEKLGFTLTATNPPDYFYIVSGKRKHRWNYRKDMLKTTLSGYDSNLTEHQNMINAGYHRIWDCGTLKYVSYP